MPLLVFCCGSFSHDLHGQLIYYQAIIQPTIAASFLSGNFLRPNARYLNHQRRSRHYHLRLNARQRPVERPFRDPVRQFTLPATWKWKRRTPLAPWYGISRFFWKAHFCVCRSKQTLL